MSEMNGDRPSSSGDSQRPAPNEAEATQAMSFEATDPQSITGYDRLPTARVTSGQVVGDRYRLDQQLARRGATLTWRAFDQKLSRSVVVHVLAGHDPRTGSVLDAARKAAVATDSRFLRVLDAMEGAPGSDDPSIVVCEYAPGQSLEKLLASGPLSALEAAWIGRELADAMSHMHARGLFHQRLNPDTVIVTATGNIKIVGFLIEAALHPDNALDPTVWSERELADVRAIGQVLFASLTCRWPDDRPDAPTYGMEVAPRDAHGWLTPRQVRSGVSPALDTISDQILADVPRHNEVPLRTASEVMLALGKVLGTADAAADLERRLRYPITPVRTTATTKPAPHDWAVPVTDETGRLPAVGPVDATQPVPRALAETAEQPAIADEPTGSVTRTTVRTTTRPATPRNKTARSRPWIPILIGLVLVALLIGLIQVGHMLQSRNSGKQGATGGSDTGPTTYRVASGKDFDPASAGGDNSENSAEVPLAFDGKTATAWHTSTYLNKAKLGGLKPGVGIMVDLGQ